MHYAVYCRACRLPALALPATDCELRDLLVVAGPVRSSSEVVCGAAVEPQAITEPHISVPRRPVAPPGGPAACCAAPRPQALPIPAAALCKTLVTFVYCETHFKTIECLI
jgi:hypothetical protein